MYYKLERHYLLEKLYYQCDGELDFYSTSKRREIKNKIYDELKYLADLWAQSSSEINVFDKLFRLSQNRRGSKVFLIFYKTEILDSKSEPRRDKGLNQKNASKDYADSSRRVNSDNCPPMKALNARFM